jgi:PAS domain S-box-containing protein
LEALDASQALIFLADEKMQYAAVNETACKRLGYSREEILALRVTDVAVGPDALDEYTQMVKAGLRSGKTHIKTKDGRRLAFSYRASEVRVAHLPYYLSIGYID